MTVEEQFDAFCGELEALLSRYQEEFDLNDAFDALCASIDGLVLRRGGRILNA